MLRRICNLFLIILLLIPTLFFPSMEVEAKTLADYKRELADLENQKTENEQKQQLTEKQIKNVTTSITNNTNTINQLSKDLIKLQEEIVKAEKDIESKEKEVKEILNFLQVSQGESAYLEYAFGAKDFTDFIYRVAVTEQLSAYNEELVKQYNELIESNKKKKVETAEKQESLRKKQVELSNQKTQLGKELKTTSDVTLSLEDAIRLQKAQIKYLESLKCGENEDVDECIERNQVLPAGTAFYRPVVSGRVSSEFGSRCYWLKGKYRCDLHGGIDLAQSGEAVPVYAAAPGIVVGIVRYWECGGNEIFIVHNINGKKYTSMYAHLRNIMVKQNQIVTMDTQIATMGGDPSREYWDGCSTGQHLHFTLAHGHYGTDYSFQSWPVFEANMFNPRIMLNVPGTGSRFNGRYRKY